jgi:hypothetical protein
MLLPAQVLYWSQFGSVSQVGHVNLDGSGKVTDVQPRQVLGMETLDATRQVYWIDNGAQTIMRANADFSDATVLVQGLSAVGNNLNLALAPAANLIFWSSADAGTISWANLNGGSILGTFASPGAYPDDLAVDEGNQLLYWATQSGEVVRSQYDGSGQTTLLALRSGPAFAGLALDLPAQKIYLSMPNEHRITSLNLDGTGLQTVLSTTERPFGMELYNGRMYWTDLDDGRLRSANLDGSDPTTILAGLTGPRQVSIMTVPEPAITVLIVLGSAILMVWRRVAKVIIANQP